MSLHPYKVVSAFIDLRSGERVDPPGEWVPPDKDTADRLVKAGCLRNAAQVAVGRDVRVTLSGDQFSQRNVTELVEQINTAVSDGNKPKPTGGKKRKR